jgi:CTP:molybdopterin cytidylyltransferase MocA
MDFRDHEREKIRDVIGNAIMDMKDMTALILAAGLSSRMGRTKALLTMGDDTVIGRSAGLFLEAGIGKVLVVLGHKADQLIPLLDKRNIPWIMNADYHLGMFSSIRQGVRALDPGCRAFFILPGDMPLVRPETIQRLAAAFACNAVPKADVENALSSPGEGGIGERPQADPVVYHPCYQDRRGHPPLISAALIPAVLAFDGPGGLRTLLARFEDRSVEVACHDPGILIDLDTPADCARYAMVDKAGDFPYSS